MREVGLTEHITVNGIDRDDAGWFSAICECGFPTGEMPDSESVVDALMEHVSLAVQVAIRRTP